MEKKIRDILEDLYAADPSLKEHERRLSRLVEHLIALRPHAEYDAVFEERLRRALMRRAAMLKEGSRPSLAAVFLRPRFTLPVAGLVALVAVFAAGGWYMGGIGGGRTAVFPTSPMIAQVGSDAFGSLPAPARSEASPMATGMGGGGPATFAAPAGKAIPSFGPLIRFSYAGKDISAPRPTMEVLKRVPVADAPTRLADIFSRTNMGLIDLSALERPHVDSVTLTEEGTYGHMITLDLANGSVSIQPNWDAWPNAYSACKAGGVCSAPAPLTKSNVPNDDTLIRTANVFLARYGIGTASFGAPEVDHTWEETPEGVASYVPESVSVRYPLIVNGMKVVNDGGGDEGMTVAVDVRSGHVANVFGLEIVNYEASSYPMETDTKAILAAAERGGVRDLSVPTPLSSVATVELGTPSLAYVATYLTSEEGSSRPARLLIPAYVFPITHLPEGTAYPSKQVVVPLAKSFFAAAGDATGRR